MDDDMPFDIKQTYLKFLEEDPQLTMPVAAIQSLVALLADAQPKTSAELIEVLQEASQTLKDSVPNSISLSAGSDLFLRFVVRNIHDYSDWEACKRNLVENGRTFAERAKESRSLIARLGLPFVRDNDIILVHGRSRAVHQLLELAASNHVRFQIYVTEARVCAEGQIAAAAFRKLGIPTCMIPDSSVGYVIPKVHKVFLGAEGVAESGGVINQIGSSQVAMLAHQFKKPVFVLAESHKFVRLFPLSSDDLTTETPYTFTTTETEEFDPANGPQIDFTPHKYITALITDLGVLTPSGVSEELIKIWFG